MRITNCMNGCNFSSRKDKNISIHPFRGPDCHLDSFCLIYCYQILRLKKIHRGYSKVEKNTSCFQKYYFYYLLFKVIFVILPLFDSQCGDREKVK